LHSTLACLPSSGKRESPWSKTCSLPVALVVAGLTLLAELTFVLVVLQVTAEAVGLGLFLEQETGMAGRALGLRVLAEQRVFGLFVVIKDRDAPVFLDMTALALVAEFALVTFAFVVLPMTGHACRQGPFLVQNAVWPVRALGCTMLALERVFGVAVVIEA